MSTSRPATKDEFKEFCLRRLGKPVLQINIDDDQIEDCVQTSLNWWWDYNFDGTEKQYYKHQVTANTIANGCITLPEEIIGVVNVFSVGTLLTGSNIFDFNYQYALNNMHDLANGSLVPYYMTKQYMEFIQQILIGSPPIRYNRHRNLLYIDMNWNKVSVGTYLVFEVYQKVDPDTFSDAWSDRWLQRYCVALMKHQWGTNMSKFTNIPMLGGLTMNGQQIKEEAAQELKDIEEEMLSSYNPILVDMIG